MKYYGDDKEALGKAILHLTAVGKLKHGQTTCTVLKQSFITANYWGWQGISGVKTALQTWLTYFPAWFCIWMSAFYIHQCFETWHATVWGTTWNILVGVKAPCAEQNVSCHADISLDVDADRDGVVEKNNPNKVSCDGSLFSSNKQWPVTWSCFN